MSVEGGDGVLEPDPPDGKADGLAGQRGADDDRDPEQGLAGKAAPAERGGGQGEHRITEQRQPDGAGSGSWVGACARGASRLRRWRTSLAAASRLVIGRIPKSRSTVAGIDAWSKRV